MIGQKIDSMNRTQQNSFDNLQKTSRKAFALLIDPDKAQSSDLENLLYKASLHNVDYIFVGGSLVNDDAIRDLVPYIKEKVNIPVILFPGSPQQIVKEADAILFLSLISGRNPDLLIGRHVEAAPLLRRSGLEILPTGYILVDCGQPTTASYISHTFPLPYNKPQIAACTAIAGEMLGLRLIYLDGGSGAQQSIHINMIKAVREQISVPLIVGGGIRTAKQAEAIWKAGADVIVVGQAIEEAPDSSLMEELASTAAYLNRKLEMKA